MLFLLDRRDQFVKSTDYAGIRLNYRKRGLMAAFTVEAAELIFT